MRNLICDICKGPASNKDTTAKLNEFIGDALPGRIIEVELKDRRDVNEEAAICLNCLIKVCYVVQARPVGKEIDHLSDWLELVKQSQCGDCGGPMVAVRPGKTQCVAECHFTVAVEEEMAEPASKNARTEFN